MEIWFDSCDRNAIRAACRFGLISGVTTNPKLMAETHEDPEKILSTLLEIQDGPVAVQVTSEQSEKIVEEALSLHTFSDRILVKIPVTRQGLVAMKQLVEQEVSILATAIFHPNQALLAALVKADYIAPYVGRMQDAGLDAFAGLKSMVAIYRQYGFKTKILAAGLRTAEQIQMCAEIGIGAVTLKNSLFEEWTADSPDTLDSLREFALAWESKEHLPFTLM
jgi:transaldolase